MNNLYSIQLKNIKRDKIFSLRPLGKISETGRRKRKYFNSFTPYDIWDGTQEGNPSSDGTYFLVVNLTTFEDKEFTEKQFLTLFGK